MDLLGELVALEERLLRLGPACGPDEAETLLDDDFREFGGSGRVLSRQAVMEEIVDAPERTFTLSDARCIPLGGQHALLTYRATVEGRSSLRSSLWVRHGGGWRMLFHQGTRTP